MLEQDKKLMLIVNPTAGKNKAQEQMFPLTNYFFGEGYQVTTFPTREKGDATKYVCRYSDDYDMIVCVGGDGTLNEVVTGLMNLSEEKRPLLGYIPAGTTNDFASTLGISSDMDEAMKQCINGVPFSCDIGKFQQRFFTYVAAFGLFTEVSYDTPQELKNALGHFAYILEGIKSLAGIRSYTLKVEVDGELIEDTFIYGQISNSTSIGGVMDIGHTGVQLDDGLFEVLMIKMPTNPIELSETIGALTFQKVDDCPHIYFRRGRHIRVLSAEEVPWTLDGESGGTHREIEAEIIPHAISIALAHLPKDSQQLAEPSASE